MRALIVAVFAPTELPLVVELPIAFADTSPPVVVTVVIEPAADITTPVGLGLLTVGCGISAIAPVLPSVLIVAPPRSIVLPLKNKSLNL